MATCSDIFFYEVFSDSSCFIFLAFYFIALKGPCLVSFCNQRQAEPQRWSISWLDLTHAFVSSCHTREMLQWWFHSAHNQNLSILLKPAWHWYSPLTSARKHLRIWMLTSQRRNQSGMRTEVSFVYKLDHLHTIPALKWLGQPFMAKSSASWPCFLPKPSSNRTCLLLQLL